MASSISKSARKAAFQKRDGRGLLFYDVHWAKFGDKTPNWQALVATSNDPAPVVGVILKATEGLGSVNNQRFFTREWRRIPSVLFRGAYHYLRVERHGARQAEVYLSTVGKAGGFDLLRDLMPIVDIERGSSGANLTAPASQFADVAEAFCQRILELSGRPCMLYGRSVPSEAGRRSKMGCRVAWNPGYTRRMPPMPKPWTRGQTGLWQYTNGATNLTTFPSTVKGIAVSQLSVFLGRHPSEMLDPNAIRSMLIRGEV